MLLLLIVALTLAACGGDGSTEEAPDDETAQPAGDDQSDEDQSDGDVGTGTELDPSFDVGSLPDDFPSQLVPDSFTAGMYFELGEVRNVNFEVSGSFDEVVAEYTEKLGEPPIVVEGEQRLASWTVDDVWQVSIIEASPVLVGIATAG